MGSEAKKTEHCAASKLNRCRSSRRRSFVYNEEDAQKPLEMLPKK
jgi:hypothetical protein